MMDDQPVSPIGALNHHLRNAMLTTLGYTVVLGDNLGPQYQSQLRGIKQQVARMEAALLAYQEHLDHEEIAPRLSVANDLCNGCGACSVGINTALASCRHGALIKE